MGVPRPSRAVRIVVLSSCDAVDVFLIQALRSRFDGVQVWRPVWVQLPRAERRSLWSRISAAKLAARVRGAVRTWRTGRISLETSRLLFGTDEPPSVPDCDPVRAHEINGRETADRLRTIDPDFLVLSGAPLLEEAIFTIPKIATLNVHYGIAPDYRGEDTIFWPLYRGDYENIGVTLHQVDERIDTGRILAAGYPALERGDTESTLTAKCARLAAELMVELLEDGRCRPTSGAEQESRGQLCLKRHRKVWRDIHYVLLRRIGRRTPRPRVASTVRHFDSGDGSP